MRGMRSKSLVIVRQKYRKFNEDLEGFFRVQTLLLIDSCSPNPAVEESDRWHLVILEQFEIFDRAIWQS